MKRFYKLVEISKSEYIRKTNDSKYSLYSQSIIPIKDDVYIAVDPRDGITIDGDELRRK